MMYGMVRKALAISCLCLFALLLISCEKDNSVSTPVPPAPQKLSAS